MRSEEEIGKAIEHLSSCTTYMCCAVSIDILMTELLTLRRRLDRENIATIILEEILSGKHSHETADAIIKYLTEG